MELFISLIAATIALYAVFVQRQELAAQREELKKSAEANDKAQLSLNKQTELQAPVSLLDAEIHLHNFNNKQELNPEKQKKWASKNFEKINALKERIESLLNSHS